jgi:hypothetical protein
MWPFRAFVVCAAFAACAVARGEELLGGPRPLAVSDLPASPFRTQLEKLPPAAREHALDCCKAFAFPRADAASLRASAAGGVYYACAFPAKGAPTTEPPAPGPAVAATVPVSPFPNALKLHSRPGATNVLFLDFDGHTVTGTDWNIDLARDPIVAVAFSTDTDYANFSDSEQAAIRSIWQRMAEDFAPFNIDVTTEEPASFTRWTGRALLTRSTDIDGNGNPSSGAGGVAYVSAFGGSSYAYYSPAWIYVDNLGGSAANCAEAASHELGHNLGLSHDGTSAGGAEYYSGHGSGDTSWGPIMGTGYGDNVSQWCRGEYYDANNTQDDLAIISGRTGYRPDDHANVHAGATALQRSGPTDIRASTPETDPANTNSANKGVLARTNDVDVFVFTCGPGAVNLAVRPWTNSSSTRGGNLDVLARLYDSGGTLLARADPTSQTFAVVSAVVTAGVYYLHVSDTATGNPLASPPAGYTAYGSVGQYFITGSIPVDAGVVIPPGATLSASNLTEVGSTSHLFAVTYTDDLAIDAGTLGDDDVVVTGPGGYSRTGELVTVDLPGGGTPRVATYRIAAPAGSWSFADNGAYTVAMRGGSVADTEGEFVPGGALGGFTCAVPAVVYVADCIANPGWTFTGTNWAYGKPAGLAGDPAAGFTGTNVVGFNLNGSYPRTVTNETATTPAFSCAGADTVTLRFRRKLGLRTSDTMSIQIAADGTPWSTVWSTGTSASDTTWQAVSYDLTAAAAGRTNVQLRWVCYANGNSSVSFGWNIDDVQVLAAGTGVVAAPPALTLVADGPGTIEALPGPALLSLGTTVQLTAIPSNYHAFAGWSGDATGLANPVSVLLTADRVVTARFSAVITTNHATPHAWLAAQGVTNDFEAGAEWLGANGLPLWQSWIAGLEPADPAAQFDLEGIDPAGPALAWAPVSGRVYEVHWAPAPGAPFLPLATNLVWPAASYTDTLHGADSAGCYQLRVRLAP